MMKHPRFLKNQVRLEINASVSAFAPLDLLTLPWFVAEVRGHSKIYDSIDAHPWGWIYAALSVPFFLVFTDFCIYWVHRLEHHPRLYKHVHKPHHKWLGEFPDARRRRAQLGRKGKGRWRQVECLHFWKPRWNPS